MGIDIKETSETEFKASAGSRGAWDKTGILEFAKELKDKYSGKVVSMPLESQEKDKEGFYNKFRRGTKKIAYISYYCRKHLLEAFETIGASADVKTTKNIMMVKIADISKEETEADVDSEE